MSCSRQLGLYMDIMCTERVVQICTVVYTQTQTNINHTLAHNLQR
jgi:hypothetical protein